MEVGNLLVSEISGLDSKVKWIETDATDVQQIISLLIASQENCENTAVKNVLGIVSEKLENILVNDIVELNRNITKIEKLADSLSEMNVQTKRTSQRKTTASRKPRVKKTPDVVDMVDTILDKEKQVVNS